MKIWRRGGGGFSELMTKKAGDDEFSDVGSVGTRNSHPHHSVE